MEKKNVASCIDAEIVERGLENLAKCIQPSIVAFFESEEGKKEFADWLQAKKDAKSQDG